MSTNTKSRIVPVAVAGLCLLAGLAAGIAMNKLDDGSLPDSAAVGSTSEEAKLEALQKQLLRTLVLPEDFKTVPEFSLLDGNSQPLDETVFDNQWSVVFFGFTHCPDVCPITLTVMQDVVEQLQAFNVPQPQTLFFTVDPKRDTPEVMKNYVGYFNSDFIGVTGELNEMLQLTKSLGIVAAFTAREDDPTQYDVDHTASMLLIDPQGRMRAKLTAPHAADTIVTDYVTLLNALAPAQSAALELN